MLLTWSLVLQMSGCKKMHVKLMEHFKIRNIVIWSKVLNKSFMLYMYTLKLFTRSFVITYYLPMSWTFVTYVMYSLIFLEQWTYLLFTYWYTYWSGCNRAVGIRDEPCAPVTVKVRHVSCPFYTSTIHQASHHHLFVYVMSPHVPSINNKTLRFHV